MEVRYDLTLPVALWWVVTDEVVSIEIPADTYVVSSNEVMFLAPEEVS